MRRKKSKAHQDLPMKLVIAGLITLSFVQWMAKAAVLEGLQTIKGHKKRHRENI